MRKVIFSRSVLKRIAEIQSSHFSKEETMHFQIKLIQAISSCHSVISYEGFREYYKGPWANTRRVIVLGYKVYYVYDQNDEAINVRAIKAPKMK
jgi:hypothetical protein